MPASGSQSARQLSPSARAREHEKKLKAREQKRMEAQAPGPGSYEPRGFKSDGDKLCGSMAFKTKTPRSNGENDRSLRDLTLSAWTLFALPNHPGPRTHAHAFGCAPHVHLFACSPIADVAVVIRRRYGPRRGGALRVVTDVGACEAFIRTVAAWRLR